MTSGKSVRNSMETKMDKIFFIALRRVRNQQYRQYPRMSGKRYSPLPFVKYPFCPVFSYVTTHSNLKSCIKILRGFRKVYCPCKSWIALKSVSLECESLERITKRKKSNKSKLSKTISKYLTRSMFGESRPGRRRFGRRRSGRRSSAKRRTGPSTLRRVSRTLRYTTRRTRLLTTRAGIITPFATGLWTDSARRNRSSIFFKEHAVTLEYHELYLWKYLWGAYNWWWLSLCKNSLGKKIYIFSTVFRYFCKIKILRYE